MQKTKFVDELDREIIAQLFDRLFGGQIRGGSVKLKDGMFNFVISGEGFYDPLDISLDLWRVAVEFLSRYVDECSTIDTFADYAKEMTGTVNPHVFVTATGGLMK